MGNIEVSNVTQHPTEDAAELDPFGLFPVDDLQGGSDATRRNACLVNAFGVAVTDAAQARGRLALRRAITVRRLCADGMYEAFVAERAAGA